MLRLVLYALFIVIGYKVFKRFFRSLDSSPVDPLIRSAKDKLSVDDLVKDPVCGVYVPVKTAVSVNHEGKIIYFCSESCRKKYLDS